MKYRKAIFIITYSISKGKIYYLILKRKLHWRGWEFPKGGLETLKERIFPKEAVKREIKEETGLTVQNIKKYRFSGKFKYSKPLKDRLDFIGQTFKLFSAKVKKKKPNLKGNTDAEHSDYLWTDYKTALKKLTWPNQRKCLRIVNAFLQKSFSKKS